MNSDRTQSDHSSQSQWLLPSKLFRQQPQSWQIERSGALRKLESALEHRLIIIQAPAGYGKSTILAQWGQALTNADVRVAWLILDESDKDTGQFLAYLLAAIKGGEQAGAVVERRFSRSRGDAAIQRMIAFLVAQMFEIQSETVVVLDDYHRPDCPEIGQIMDRIVSSMPPSFHFAIATREAPFLQTSALRAQGKIFDLRINDLRFSIDEVQQFLNMQRSLAVSLDHARRLWKITEGWPLAIQTARLWLSSRNTDTNSIATFSGRITDIGEYLNEQVMGALSPDEQGFLLETSVLDRLSGDVANYVCERDDSWRLIEELVRRNLFLIGEDNEGRWYRYHQLFSEYLRERLERHSPARAAELTMRAGDWFAEKGFLTDAIRNYVTAKRADKAALLIEKAGGWRLLYRAYTAILRAFFQQVDEAFLKRYPRLFLACICVHIKSGHMDLAGHLLKSWDGAAYEVDSDPLLAADRLFVDSLLMDYKETPATEEDIEALRSALLSIDHGDNLLKAMLYHQLCTCCFELCRFDAAREAAEISKQYLEADGSHYATYTLDLCLGQISQCRGDLHRARETFLRIYDDMQGELGDDSDAACIARIMLAAVLYDQNRLSHAKSHIDESLRHAEQFDGWYAVYAAGYETAAALKLNLDGLAGALDVWQRAREVGEKRDLWKLTLHAEHRRILLMLKAGDNSRAKALLRRLERSTEDQVRRNSSVSQTLQIKYVSGATAIQLALCENDAGRARRLIEPLLTEAVQLGWVRERIKLLVLESQAWFCGGKERRGYHSLDQALQLASPSSFYRAFLDEGGAFLQRIRDALATDDALSTESRIFAKRVLSEEVSPGSGDGSTITSAGYGKRQLEVLRLIDDGLSSKQIAFKLGISESTVKYHRKNVYRKLKVNNRASALAKARQLSLL